MLNLTQPVLGKDGSIFENTFQQVSEEIIVLPDG